jgi:2-polyprenyl-3-methyl-5-hydroxy-6-metoxy-1,4-benzoquinol methylase
MKGQTPMSNDTAYSSSAFSHEVPTELERLHALEKAWDPYSISRLSRLPFRDDWQCLDLGAGAGSIARWLAARTARGGTTATDIDISFLPVDAPRIRPLLHDVRHDDFPPDSFDLIHARALLEHLPERTSVLAKAVTWLRPGGFAAIENIDISPGQHSRHWPIAITTSAILTLLRNQIGSDTTVGPRMPRLLAQAGLTEITTHRTTLGVGAGQPGDAFYLSTLDQLAPALVTAGLLTEDITSARDFIATTRHPAVIAHLYWTTARKPLKLKTRKAHLS